MTDLISVEPMDRHNQSLMANVHPSDWTNPEPARRYNLVVIGAGTAGLVAAAGAAGLGAKVALVERHLLGGDCLNVGCVPSKCLIRSARAYADVRSAGEHGVRVPGQVEVDFPAVMERMRRLRGHISHHDSAERFRDLGVDVFFGQACFSETDTVEVAGPALRFSQALSATGARAVQPAIEGLAEAGFLTNKTVFSLTARPGHLAVFGAGPLGCELAQAFCRLGCEVTIVERAGHLLSGEDPDAAKIVAEAFRTDGITVLVNTTVHRVTTSGSEKLLHINSDGQQRVLAVDEILVAAGRAPNVEGLDLERVRVEYDKTKGVVVDDNLRTTNKRIYAAGDVCRRHKFTHTADAAARIVLQNALFRGSKKLSALTVPWCTYTDPEIAHVGIYERDAHQRGIALQTFVMPLSEVDRAITDGEDQGLVKVHVKKGTDKILGATIVARHAGDMISQITLAMVGNLGLRAIANVLYPYPTQAEAVKRAGDAYNRTILTPFVTKLFERWLAWTR